MEKVVRVSPAVESDGGEGIGKWRIESTEKEKKIHGDEIYDAVVVCNGHYIEPRLAEIPVVGQGRRCIAITIVFLHHSKISSASVVDISRDISGFAKEVHVASWSNSADTFTKQNGYTNIWMHSMIERVHEDGSVVFQNGETVLGDVIMHCTGYKYHFPFLDTNGEVTVDDNCVGPLYKHIFPPALAPWLSFAGIPYKVLPFPMFELQSKWIAGVLSGRIKLPSKEDMMVETKTMKDTFEALGIPKRFTHCLGIDQFEYYDWLGSQIGCLGTEEWRKEMSLPIFMRKMKHPKITVVDFGGTSLYIE
ncbi:unnamed protein product [Microthlaspi erraticum]|uniref:Flavin-containing monooxygenase n=1 Tax=Microthlaspi erraticum TaxID=1685480 RepID=A0A6D2J520_9BRAS|nr:unnamed protein product [Microthlaspi erraticum]